MRFYTDAILRNVCVMHFFTILNHLDLMLFGMINAFSVTRKTYCTITGYLKRMRAAKLLVYELLD